MSAEEALARGLLVTDAARRVGWAKAYEASAQVDDLQAQVAALTREVELLRRAHSRLLGVIGGIGEQDQSKTLATELARHRDFSGATKRFPDYEAGRAIARAHRKEINVRLNNRVFRQEKRARAAARRLAERRPADA